MGLITPELENPIFPALAQVIGQALTRQGYTPVLATQTPGGSTEDELTEALVDRASPASSSSPACTPTPRRTCSATSSCAPRASRSSWSTVSRRRSRRPSSPRTTARRWPSRSRTSSCSGTPTSDSPWVEAVRARAAEDRGLRTHDAGAVGAEPGRHRGATGLEHSLYTLEGGQAAATALMDRGARRWSARAT